MLTRYSSRSAALEAVMVFVAAIFMFPLYILVIQAFKNEHDQTSPLLPTLRPTFENFLNAWNEARLGPALLISLLVAASSIVVLVVVGALASYALVRVLSRFSMVIFWVLLSGLFIPFQVALIPLYTTIRDLGLLGSPISLILYYSGQQLSFTVFLYTGFLRSLPADYEEAAALDGASRLRQFWSIVLPLLRPITGTVVILNAIAVWNDFLTPLLYLSGTKNQTVTIALYSFVGQFVSDWPLVFAGLIISVLPVLIVFFILQKNIIRGFAGGLKG